MVLITWSPDHQAVQNISSGSRMDKKFVLTSDNSFLFFLLLFFKCRIYDSSDQENIVGPHLRP